MSDFVVQKPMRTVSLSFGSSSEAVVTRLIDWPKHCVSIFKKPSQNKRFVCKHRAVSSFTTCYQSLQTVWIRRVWSGANMQSSPTLRSMITARWKEHFRQVPSFRCMPWADPEGEQGVRTPLIGFPSNIDPDPLNITKLPSQHSMVGHYRQWRFADGGPF